ncbi:MAG TPA: serine--tRNA ligase [candidate division Zixibacteria bacterium]|nr:serine--tRNA ligase [candidate division Zixibacteria bacterium]
MLDLKFIRENPQVVKDGLARKYDTSDIDKILEIDTKRREIIHRVEALKAERNAASQEIAKMKKAGESADEAIAAMRRVGEEISGLDDRLREAEADMNKRLSWLPNLPHESVPDGKNESNNVVVREWGEKPQRNFKVLPHWEIGQKLGILDLEAAVRISGSGFYLLKGLGARLLRSLINFMLDTHTADGFLEVAPPALVTAETMYGTGQLPKMADDMYYVEKDEMYLIPTAEVPVTNLYRGEIIPHEMLPLKMMAFTPCFRRESGAAGKDTRGMIRVHQFEKVELVKLVRPENSYEELESLVNQAEKILQMLKIPYRVVNLATGDLSFASAKTYDLELWAAGIEGYLEISSISNFESFQARRMNTRFRDADKKLDFPHTLNGSGLALARLVPAILENYQNADGTITVPEVLRSYMGGLDKIG